KRFREFAGSSFKLLLTLTESIIYQGPELPTLIHLTNPHSEPVLKGFKDHLIQLISAIKNEDSKVFEELFSKATTYLSKDPLFKEAYKQMYKAIEAIKKE
ncbi:MAG: prephenate dehydrogenase dimerization domain-containing protein, partial [Candidatus Hodarchaeota archaeon]